MLLMPSTIINIIPIASIFRGGLKRFIISPIPSLSPALPES
jgi:hypothetical protein